MTSISDLCKVCSDTADKVQNPALRCQGKCQRIIHVKCLKRGSLPSPLIGDVFYDLHCEECSGTNEELLVRQKMPWLTTVLLAMYNLRAKSIGLSNREYFHWRTDLSAFIDTNWDLLFTKLVKRKKNWVGTISGTLSHYSGVFFQSGTLELDQQGYWRLISSEPPDVLIDHKMMETKKAQAKLKNKNAKNHNVQVEEESNSSTECSNQNDENMSTNSHAPITTQPEVEIPQLLPMHDESEDLELDIPHIENDIVQFNFNDQSLVDVLPSKDCDEILDTHGSGSSSTDTPVEIEASDDSSQYSHSFDEPMAEDNQEFNTTTKHENEFQQKSNTFENDASGTDDLPPPKPSLLKPRKALSKGWPWEEYTKIDPANKANKLMSLQEEENLLQEMEQHKQEIYDSGTPAIRRLYRKLVVRRQHRQYGTPILNVDAFGKEPDKKVHVRQGNNVLDRYISEDVSILYEQRLQGPCEPTGVYSPYTKRLLKPFIRRDTESRPLWLRVTSELVAKVNFKKPGWKPPAQAPIDYSYIRPQHIPALNSLCAQFFWPGVDLSESLEYPDFSCVVLYKKLVIGFATMVPDAGYNEAYISFFLVRPEWRRAGIGAFMLYHLAQTCMGKDIILHVSASNPAFFLYQKFGFKKEEFVQNFYDKYLPPSSKESKHALCLRLRR